MNIKIITFYTKDDIDFSSDYTRIQVWVNDEVIEYGDSYHDKGQEKVEGFLKGVAYMNRLFLGKGGVTNIVRENRNEEI